MIRRSAQGNGKMPETWDELILRAQQAVANEDYKAAESFLTKATELTETLAPDDKRRFIVLELMAELMQAQKRFRETENYLMRAIEMRKQRYGPTHRRYADGLARIAAFFYEHERFEEAEPICREVLAIAEKLYGEKSEEAGRNSGMLAQILHAQNKLEEAEGLYKKAISIRKELAGPMDAESVNLIQHYAHLLSETGRKDEADHLTASAQGRVSGIFKLIKPPK